MLSVKTCSSRAYLWGLAFAALVGLLGCGGASEVPAEIGILDDPPELTPRQLDVVGREPVDPVSLAGYTNASLSNPRATFARESGVLTVRLRFDGTKWPWVQRGFWLLEPHEPQNAQHPRPAHFTPLLIQLRDGNGVALRTVTTDLHYGPGRYHALDTKNVRPDRLDRIVGVDDGEFEVKTSISSVEIEHLSSVAVGFSAQGVVLRQRVLGTEAELRDLLNRRGPRAREMARRTGAGNTVEEILGLPPIDLAITGSAGSSNATDDALGKLVPDSVIHVGDQAIASPHDTRFCQKVSDKLATGAGENLATMIKHAKPSQLTVRRDSDGKVAEMWLVAPVDAQGQHAIEGVTHFVRPADGGPDWLTEGWGCSTEMMWAPGLFGHEWVPASLQGRPWRRQSGWSPTASSNAPGAQRAAAEPEPHWSREVPTGPEVLPGDPVILVDDDTGISKFEKEPHPSASRQRVAAEFDEAPRDPVGPATLWDLYTILRDIDGCDPQGAGYKLSTESSRLLRNVPLARRGYTFSSEDLRGVFLKEPWYRPNPTVNSAFPPKLPELDATCVSKLHALEGRDTAAADTPGVPLPLRGLRPRASSALKEGSLIKGADRLFDGDPDTEWADGVDGPGVGEWFGAELIQPSVVVGVDIAIGHQKKSSKYGDLFALNSRPSRVRLVVGDWTQEFDLRDSRELQGLAVPAIEASEVRLFILDTYPGTRWADTSVNTVLIRVAM